MNAKGLVERLTPEARITVADEPGRAGGAAQGLRAGVLVGETLVLDGGLLETTLLDEGVAEDGRSEP